MIDSDGYRANVGIIICNDKLQVMWAKRINQQAWQFPQGGLGDGEKVEEAMYRELNEEVGLPKEKVEIISRTSRWLRYKIPKAKQRDTKPLCIGQKQKWFLLRYKGKDEDIILDKTSKPEFDSWMWVSYWYPVRQIISFKREVYRKALKELREKLNENNKGRVVLNNILDS